MAQQQHGGNMMASFANAPLFSAIYSGLLDYFIMQRNDDKDMSSSVKFALSVGAGSLIGNYVADNISQSANLPTVAERVMEVAAGSAGAYAINRYMLKNDWAQDNETFIKKVALIGASEFLATYTVEYMQGSALSYFS